MVTRQKKLRPVNPPTAFILSYPMHLWWKLFSGSTCQNSQWSLYAAFPEGCKTRTSCWLQHTKGIRYTSFLLVKIPIQQICQPCISWLHPVWIRASSISNDTLLREPKMTNLGSTYYRFWESGMAWGESGSFFSPYSETHPYSRKWMQDVSLFWFQ